MDLADHGRRLTACGTNYKRLVKVCYQLSDELHREFPDAPPPDLGRARAVAKTYLATVYGIEVDDA